MPALEGMAIVLAALGGLLGVLVLYRRLGRPHPELVRKLLHVGMGIVILALPWLFDESWPVLVLAGTCIALLLLAIRLIPRLRANLGQVLGGVSRFSLGEVYFPIAVAILWVLYVHGDPEPPGQRLVLYLVPLLLLTLSDTLAALVGIYYGRRHYATLEGTKSQEGSVAFFLCSFLCIHLPLLLLTDRGRLETVLIAVLMAWLATMFEAIAWHGLDNLVLPLVAYLLLVLYWDLPVPKLLLRLGVTVVVFAFVMIYAKRTTLAGNAVLGAFLVVYVCWALGGWHWLVPPLVLFISYPLLSPATEENSKKIHNIHTVICVASAGLLWLFVSRFREGSEWYYPFTVAFAAHLAIIGLGRLRFDYPALPAGALLLVCIAAGWLVLLSAYVLINGGTTRAFLEAAVALPAVALAACCFYSLQPRRGEWPADTPRWWRQGLCAGAASVLAFVPVWYLF